MILMTPTHYDEIRSGVLTRVRGEFSNPICAKERNGLLIVTQGFFAPRHNNCQVHTTLCLNPPMSYLFYCEYKTYSPKCIGPSDIWSMSHDTNWHQQRIKAIKQHFSCNNLGPCMSSPLYSISPLHTRSAGSGVQLPTTDIPSGDLQAVA